MTIGDPWIHLLPAWWWVFLHSDLYAFPVTNLDGHEIHLKFGKIAMQPLGVVLERDRNLTARLHSYRDSNFGNNKFLNTLITRSVWCT